MAISTEASRSTYAGNGVTTVFSTGFYFLDETELTVKFTFAGVEYVLTLGVDYTVTMPAAVGGAGSITFVAGAPASGGTIVIERDVPFTQETSFRSAGTFSREVHEDAMDELVFQTQQLDRRVKDLESAGAPGSVVAGNGVYFSGSTLHVGNNAGIIVDSDSVAVDFDNGVPNVLASDAVVGNGGVSTGVSRSDHRHAVATWLPAGLVVGNPAALGGSSGLARADHQHAVPSGVPVNVTKQAASEGVAGTFARSDHKHDISTAAAIEVTDSTNAEGTSALLSRSDHTHAHGARGGGTLHAVATTATAGFMSAADKTKLDGLAATTTTTGTVTTTDATPTQLLTFTPANGAAEVVELLVVGKEKAVSNAAGYQRKFVVKRHDGTTSLVSTVDTIGADKKDTAGWDVAVSISSPAVIVTVTGAVGDTAIWVGVARRLAVDAP